MIFRNWREKKEHADNQVDLLFQQAFQTKKKDANVHVLNGPPSSSTWASCSLVLFRPHKKKTEPKYIIILHFAIAPKLNLRIISAVSLENLFIFI